MEQLTKEMEEIIGKDICPDGGINLGGIKDFNSHYLDFHYYPESFTKLVKSYFDEHPLTSSIDFHMTTNTVIDDAISNKLKDYYMKISNDLIRTYPKKYFAAKMAIIQCLQTNISAREILEAPVTGTDSKIAQALGKRTLSFVERNKLEETYRQLQKDFLSKKEEIIFSRALIDDLFKTHYQKYESFAQFNPQMKAILKDVKLDLQSALVNCGLFQNFPFIVRAAYGKNGDKSLAKMLCDMAKQFDIVASRLK